MMEGKRQEVGSQNFQKLQRPRTYWLKHPWWGLDPWEQVSKSGPCSSSHWPDFIPPECSAQRCLHLGIPKAFISAAGDDLTLSWEQPGLCCP